MAGVGDCARGCTGGAVSCGIVRRRLGFGFSGFPATFARFLGGSLSEEAEGFVVFRRFGGGSHSDDDESDAAGGGTGVQVSVAAVFL